MKSSPLISIIICVGEIDEFIDQAIESINRQEFCYIEIIVVLCTNASDKYVRMYRNGLNGKNVYQNGNGIANARNCGILEASGEYVSFLDCDDVLTEMSIANRMHILSKENSDVVYGNLERRNLGEIPPQYNGEDFYKSILGLTPGSFIIRKSVLFEKKLFFDEKYRLAGDHDWVNRIFKSKLQLGYCNKVVLKKLIHQENLSHNTQLYRKEMLEIIFNHARERT